MDAVRGWIGLLFVAAPIGAAGEHDVDLTRAQICTAQGIGHAVRLPFGAPPAAQERDGALWMTVGEPLPRGEVSLRRAGKSHLCNLPKERGNRGANAS